MAEKRILRETESIAASLAIEGFFMPGDLKKDIGNVLVGTMESEAYEEKHMDSVLSALGRMDGSGSLVLLQKAETAACALRMAELVKNPDLFPRRLDGKCLRFIHRYLFSDLYSWAGKFRKTNLYRNGSKFLPPGEIRPALRRLTHNLYDNGLFAGNVPADDAAVFLGRFLCDLNNIHPFPEGNGRSGRMFLWRIAFLCGFDLYFDHMTQDAVYAASFYGHRGNSGPMENLIRKGLVSHVDHA